MKKRFIALALPAVMWTTLGNAAPIYDTYVSYTHSSSSGTTTVDNSAGPGSPSSALSVEVTTANGASLGWHDDAYAEATVNDFGITGVGVNGVMYNPDGGDYLTNPDHLYSRVTMSDSYTNAGGSAEDLSYSFFMQPLDLAIGDWAGAGNTDPNAPYGGEPLVEYGMTITGNGSTVWESSASLRGGRISHTLTESGTDLGGTYYEEQGGSVFGYTFDLYADTLDLGVLNPGDTMDLIAEIWVSVATAPYELGGRAGLLDPGAGNLGWGGELLADATTTPLPVPEPSTLLLLGAGIAGLMVARGKKVAA